MRCSLTQHGVTYSDPDATANLGISVCRGFDGGRTYAEVQSDIGGSAGRFTPGDVDVLIRAAIDTMCPQFADRLPR